MKVENTALFRFMERVAPAYRSKLLEVREVVEGWLSYIPQTFPHYTRHTIDHSETIIARLSRLLFLDDDAARPTVSLSGVEAYVLAAAAYLHDAGMVVSDKEKVEILRSEEWREWTTGENGGAKRWRELETMLERSKNDPGRMLSSDRQLRFLIAEFVRRRHHRRAVDVIEQHHEALGRLDFGDEVLRTTIANVCLAHGLDRSELEDSERFPERREIRDELVNVRFMAILLRVGDLLDMRSERACPILLSAASPLPSDSYAHWSQYQRIVHQMVAPDRIELRAECLRQEEHRFLHDWCSWLVDEIRYAALIAASAARHRWNAPKASIGDGGDETIVIRPAKGATYLPRNWQFELDVVRVFERLIRDAYDSPNAFIRELVQNSLDAIRCRMYADLRRDGAPMPEYPVDVSPDRRKRYEIRISLEDRTVRNELSEEVETRQFLTIDDDGIGMNQEVIERYLLQVGRSYYTTESFRRSFPFHPVSRFGVGFLSVFAVSDHVTVDTLRMDASPSNDPIRLTLTGPRSYLLTERGERRAPGTRISLQMRTPLPRGSLTTMLKALCRRVEFDVRITEYENEEIIHPEPPDTAALQCIDPEDPKATVFVRTVPVSEKGVFGELYVMARMTEFGESWAEGFRVHQYRERYPFSKIPELPSSYRCSHGLARGLRDPSDGWYVSIQCDDRRPVEQESLDRSGTHRASRQEPWMDKAWSKAVLAHLQSSTYANKYGWYYIHRLASCIKGSWWLDVPKSIPVRIDGHDVRMSAAEVCRIESFTTISGVPEWGINGGWRYPIDRTTRNMPETERGVVLFSDDIGRFDQQLCEPLFRGRRPTAVRLLGPSAVLIEWTRSEARPDVCMFDDTDVVALHIHSRTNKGYGDSMLRNLNHPAVAWALWALEADIAGAKTLWAALGDSKDVDKVNHLLKEYGRASGLGRHPPAVVLTRQSYEWQVTKRA